MSTSEQSWYVKTESTSEGPLPLAELKQRARSGHLVGSAQLSSNANGPWANASTLEELELEWVVLPEGKAPLAPCHVLSLRHGVEHGDVEPFWDIQHVPTGDTYEVVDALCSALLTQNRILETRLEAMTPLGEGSGEDPVVEDAVENLLRSLELKSQILEDLRRKLERVEEERDQERRHREEDNRQSGVRLEELTTHLSEMDEAISDLTRKYRDLNDRFIRMRSQIPASS